MRPPSGKGNFNFELERQVYMIRAAISLTGLASLLNVLLATESDSTSAVIISILSALVVGIMICFIGHYLKTMSKAVSRNECGEHRDKVYKRCDKIDDRIDKKLCLIIKHLGIEKNEEDEK